MSGDMKLSFDLHLHHTDMVQTKEKHSYTQDNKLSKCKIFLKWGTFTIVLVYGLFSSLLNDSIFRIKSPMKTIQT